jgi:acyl-coenzyme A thioesterase PaaI-like protein
MSAKKLGRFTAGLFVALGLAFGGSLLAAADSSGMAYAAPASPISASALQLDLEWQ